MTAEPTVDLGWFRDHLLGDILPHWLAAAVTPNGFFHPQLDRQWRRREPGAATLVSQSRLLYVFAAGYRLTGDTRYLDAVRSGADFLIEHLFDRVHDGCCWSCDSRGGVLSDHKSAYGHAFALFGLAHAFGVTGDARYQQAAVDVRDVVRGRFADVHGGLVPGFSADFAQAEPGRSQNPVMHLFEALLALAGVGDVPDAMADARRVAEFVLTRLVRPRDGALPEVYDDDWRPLPADRGGRIDLGHQFEWAYLLSHAVDAGLPPEWLGPARRLLGTGLRVGLDEDGGVLATASPNGRLASRHKGWWQQCEAVRALLHWALARGAAECAEPAARALAFSREHLVDPLYGGWTMAPVTDGGPRSADKGNEWKVDYHVVGMCVEAARLADALSPCPRARPNV